MRSLNTKQFWIAPVSLLLVSVWLFLPPSPAKVVVLDKSLLMQGFVKELSQKNLSDEDLAQWTHVFTESLKASIADYAKRHHAIVLKKESTYFAEVADVTDEIGRLVVEKMREAS